MGQNVEEAWKNLKITITKAAGETMEKKRQNTSDWFDETDEIVQKLLNEKKKMHEIYMSNPSKENERKWKSARKICQNKVRMIKDNWWSKKAQELQDYINAGDSYNLYNGIKSLTGPTKRSLAILEDENGNKIQDQDKRLEKWSKYFEHLYNQEFKTDESAIRLDDIEDTNIDDEVPNKEEIKEALKHIKNNKTPGQDTITGEMLKAGGETAINLLPYFI